MAPAAVAVEAPVPGASDTNDPDTFCLAQPVSYYYRVDNPGAYDWCVVPNTSYDVVLFGGLAVVMACLLQGKLNTLMVLVAGAALMAIAWPVNLGPLGNSLAIWLGISPWQLFFYVFLPPLLLDAAVRIDWFMFRKSFVQVFTLAFLVVGATCVAMIPIMLYILDLKRFGWNWLHACMFGAMVASTDAVAIVSIMKTSGGPKRLRVMLEGESLLNDASGLTLFEVFFHLLQSKYEHPEHEESIGQVVGEVFLAVVQLSLIGFVMGMAFGVLTRLFLRFMRYMGAGHDQEVALTLGMAYLAYWVTGVPCKGSGVVAVAVMGLYGAATNCWDMSTHAHHTFDGFWETLAFVVNSLVFLYSGASVVNFFIRASGDLMETGDHSDLPTTLWMLPIIFIVLTLLRFGLTFAFRPLFILMRGDLSFKECIFVCAAGLRGSASLIMGSAVVTEQLHTVVQPDTTFDVVRAMMVFWTAGFVLLTLLINAPLLPTVLRLTGLSVVPPKQITRRQRAVAALAEHTAVVLDQLRDAEDELLAGVDWAQVASFVDHGRKYNKFTGRQPGRRSALRKFFSRLWVTCCCCCRGYNYKKQRRRSQLHSSSNKKHSRSSAGKRHDSNGPAADSGYDLEPNDKVVSASVTFGSTSKTVWSQDPSMDEGSGAADGLSRFRTQSATGASTTPSTLTDANGRTATDWDPELGHGPLSGGSGGSGQHKRRQQRRHPKKGRHQNRQKPNELQPTAIAATGSTGTALQQDGGQRSTQRRRSDSSSRTSRSGHGSGAVSDNEGTSSNNEHTSSSNTSNTSSSSSDDHEADGFFSSVLPLFGRTRGDIDVLHQECPFMGARFGTAAQQQQRGSTSNSSAAAASVPSAQAAASLNRGASTPVGTTAGGVSSNSDAAAAFDAAVSSTGADSKPRRAGFVSRFWAPRLRRTLLPAASSPPIGSGSLSLPAPDQIQQEAAAVGAANATGLDGSGRFKNAFAAAVAFRQPSGAADQPRNSSRRGSSKGTTVGPAAATSQQQQQPGQQDSGSVASGRAPRSLATRSCAPAFAHGADRAATASTDLWSAPPDDSSSRQGALAAHTRRGSGGSAFFTSLGRKSFNPSEQRSLSSVALGASNKAGGAGAAAAGGWGLAASMPPPREPAAISALGGQNRGVAEAEPSGGSPRAGSRQPLHLQTEQALGRTSVNVLSLASQSITMGDRYGGHGQGSGGAAMNDGQNFGNTLSNNACLQLPEGSEAAYGAGGAAGYDAAAAAVDMVSLARSSRRGAARTANGLPAADGALDDRTSRMRSLASRSVGMPGAYAYTPGSQQPSRRSVGMPEQELAPLRSGAPHGAGGGGGSGSSGMRSLATRSLASRSINPSMAALAPSLQALSTGMGVHGGALAAAETETPGPYADINSSSMRMGGLGYPAGVSSNGREGRVNSQSRSLASRSVPAAAAAAAAEAAKGRLVLPPIPSQHDPASAAAGGGGGGGTAGSLTRPSSAGRDLASSSRLFAAASTVTADPAAQQGSSVLQSIGRPNTGGMMDALTKGLQKMSAPLRGQSMGGASGDGGFGRQGDLAKTSVFDLNVEASDVGPEELADARSWLVSGLKRYFHAKRMEGLLSARGLRILDYSCDTLLDEPHKRLALWGIISRDAGSNVLVRLLTAVLFACRQAAIGLVSMGPSGSWLAWPLRMLAGMLQRPLNKVLLSSVEVAMEYLMGLTTSPYVEWLQETEGWGCLVQEIQAEASQIAQFLIDREIEAPERYSAVQSYRVAMAVLRQQKLFVESLFESGMIDALEQGMLSHPIEAAERRLELMGPVWKAPSLGEILRQLPFMRGQSASVVEFFVRYGHLEMLSSGSSLPRDSKDLYVVQGGIVKVTYQPDLGEVQEYFLGAGGVYNLYSSLTQETLPGRSQAVAQGNALGKGPVLFCFTAKGLQQLSALAAAGDSAYQQLELDMHRLAGMFLLERLKPQVELEVSQALARLAPLRDTGSLNTHTHNSDAADAPAAAAAANGEASQQKAKHSSRQQRATWVRQRLALLRAHLKQHLISAELLLLPKGASVNQDSHLVLMQGSIHVKVEYGSSAASDDVKGTDCSPVELLRVMSSVGRHQHQSILPWLWDVLSEEDVRAAPVALPQGPFTVTITAGPEGATLLVCPSDGTQLEDADTAAADSAAGIAAPSTARLHPLRAAARKAPDAAQLDDVMVDGFMPSVAADSSSQTAAAEAQAATLQQAVGPAPAAWERRKGRTAPSPSGQAAKQPHLRLMELALQQQQSQATSNNPFLRRSFRAAAAADALMEPLPGSTRLTLPASILRVGSGGGVGSAVGAAVTRSSTGKGSNASADAGSRRTSADTGSRRISADRVGDATVSAAAEASADATPFAAATIEGEGAGLGTQPSAASSGGMQDYFRGSPVVLGSSLPLAGAPMDNTALVGADRRHSGSLAGSSLTPAEESAINATLGDADTMTQQQQAGDGAAATAAAAARPAAIRRSKSIRPLKARDGGERRVGGK